jgi:hypothetical protein
LSTLGLDPAVDIDHLFATLNIGAFHFSFRSVE